MTMSIHKLIIIRAAKATEEVLADFRAQFAAKFNEAVAQPISILPVVWSDQTDPSHIGFVVSGLNLKEIRAVEAYEKSNPHSTVYDLKNTTDKAIGEALLTNGLRIHPLVERTQGT
jgi:hypothetical protein